MFAGGDRRPVDFRESLREIAQTLGQRVSFDHLAAHTEHDSLYARFFGLFGDRLQRFLERQTGAQQRRQLSGQQRQVQRREAAAHEAAAAATFRFALRGLLHIHRQQLFVAQQLPDVLRGIPFDQAFALPSLDVKGRVFEGSHQAPLVPSPRG